MYIQYRIGQKNIKKPQKGIIIVNLCFNTCVTSSICVCYIKNGFIQKKFADISASMNCFFYQSAYIRLLRYIAVLNLSYLCDSFYTNNMKYDIYSRESVKINYWDSDWCFLGISEYLSSRHCLLVFSRASRYHTTVERCPTRLDPTIFRAGSGVNWDKLSDFVKIGFRWIEVFSVYRALISISGIKYVFNLRGTVTVSAVDSKLFNQGIFQKKLLR